ncbi:hypothetical protein NB714_003272 [Pantoea dispersa]|nr:hypothetical protein [Pantoea dispersa]MCW0327147.1 hypothetical protein [Pantoea dispersa]
MAGDGATFTSFYAAVTHSNDFLIYSSSAADDLGAEDFSDFPRRHLCVKYSLL